MPTLMKARAVQNARVIPNISGCQTKMAAMIISTIPKMSG
jgi:hypothetical protein